MAARGVMPTFLFLGNLGIVCSKPPRSPLKKWEDPAPSFKGKTPTFEK